MRINLFLTSEKGLSYLILCLPINVHWLKIVLPTNCESLTDKSLSNINFTGNDIGKIIKGLDSSKAHGHDMISIRMLNFAEGPFTNLYGLSSGIVSSKGSLLLLEKRQRLFCL